MNASNLIPRIPEEEITLVVAALLEIIQKQAEEIQMLKDEIIVDPNVKTVFHSI